MTPGEKYMRRIFDDLVENTDWFNANQIRQALTNTRQKTRNHAPVIFQAIRNDKTAGAVSSSPWADTTTKEACCGCCKV